MFESVLDGINSKVTPEMNRDSYRYVSVKDWNQTDIAPIPKIDNPETIFYFHPISLCNVLYKLVTKALSNRLQGIMGKIVSVN